MNHSINFEEIKSRLLKDQKLLGDLLNEFDPSRPLRDDHPAYVNCQNVRGDGNIIQRIGKRIALSKGKIVHKNDDGSYKTPKDFDISTSCHLYAGHRGGGKSTELYRLQKYLENNNCFVIYLNSDEYLDFKNVQYTDILLACTRRIIEELKADPIPLRKWLEELRKNLEDLGLSEFEIQELNLELQFLGTKIGMKFKPSPDNREKIRKLLEKNIVGFNEALNEFIKESYKRLPDDNSKMVVIVDNLDKIPIEKNPDGRTICDEIFIDNSIQLRNLNCHLIYTVPIDVVYSERAGSFRDCYGDIEVLPMIRIKDEHNRICDDGIDKVKELIQKRLDYTIKNFLQNNRSRYLLSIDHTRLPNFLSLEDIFDVPKTLERLCLITGGHLREVMFLVQASINRIDQLPITREATERAIATSRNTYKQLINDQHWDLLARIAESKRLVNDEQYRQLLLDRCVLEYREADEKQKIWHDVHPLIKEIDEFKEAYQRLEKSNGITQENQEKENQEKENQEKENG